MTGLPGKLLLLQIALMLVTGFQRSSVSSICMTDVRVPCLTHVFLAFVVLAGGALPAWPGICGAEACQGRHNSR
jgi:hypothetical protein